MTAAWDINFVIFAWTNIWWAPLGEQHLVSWIYIKMFLYMIKKKKKYLQSQLRRIRYNNTKKIKGQK